MVDNIGDNKKLGKVKGASTAKGVTDAQDVATVGKAAATSKVAKVGGASTTGKRRPTRTMTLAEREELFSIINEEAQKMFKNSGLPPQQQEIVTRAVEMAVDSALIPEDGSSDSTQNSSGRKHSAGKHGPEKNSARKKTSEKDTSK